MSCGLYLIIYYFRGILVKDLWIKCIDMFKKCIYMHHLFVKRLKVRQSFPFKKPTGMIVDFLFSDKLGSTVFAPVKMDFVGNIKVHVYEIITV